VIPIHDVNPTRRFAWVTVALIAANVAVFLLWQPTFRGEEAQQEFFFCHAEIPWEVLAPATDTGPAGRDLLLVGQGLDMEGVALARRQADALLDHARRDGTATLLLPPVNDGPLVQLVADRAARSHIEVEAVYPVGEPKGAALLDLVATETRLRGPDGCPWDREQTHASLARHLVEEAYEVLDAIEEGDPEHLREELGDLLLQVVFHAQLAEDAGEFDVDGVARAITEKLVRRHPHVFGDLRVDSAGEVVRNWEAIKREEEGRTDPLAGIPSALPALQLAAKLQKRAPGGLAAEAGRDRRMLDVEVLHGPVLSKRLGVSDFEGRVSYESDLAAAVAAVDQGAAASVLILRPARFGAVATIAAGGETLPQKTTFFYPKPRDGLVLRPLD